MSRCRSTSFYLAPNDLRYFKDVTLAIVASDGNLVEVKHRNDIKGWEATDVAWDGRVLVGPPGGLEALRLEIASNPTAVEVWEMDSRIVEGRRPADAAAFAMHRMVVGGAAAAGGIPAAVGAIAGDAPRSVRKALLQALESDSLHSAYVVSAAWRSGLLDDPNIATRLLQGPSIPGRVLPEQVLDDLFKALAESQVEVDVESLLSSMVSSQLLSEKTLEYIALLPNADPQVLRSLYFSQGEANALSEAVSRNPNAPVDVLRDIFSKFVNDGEYSSGNNAIDIALSRNPNTPSDILAKVHSVTLPFSTAFDHLCKNPNTSTEVLADLLDIEYAMNFAHMSSNIADAARSILQHPNVPADFRDQALQNKKFLAVLFPGGIDENAKAFDVGAAERPASDFTPEALLELGDPDKVCDTMLDSRFPFDRLSEVDLGDDVDVSAVRQARSLLENRPFEVPLASDLAYLTLVDHGAQKLDLSAPVENVEELGPQNAPYQFSDSTLKVRSELQKHQVNVSGHPSLAIEVISSPRALSKNANYMGNCSKGWDPKIKAGHSLLLALYHTDPKTGKKTTVFNCDIQNYGSGWMPIGEINSRFNKGVSDEEKEAIQDQLRKILAQSGDDY